MTPADEKNKKRNLTVFAWSSFFNDLGSDMIYPIWPLFVTTVMGANMAIMGLIDGLGEAIVSLSQAGSGYLSDRLKRRKVFVWIGYACGVLSRLGYAISTVWQQLIPLKILDRAGKMRAAPRDAMVADFSQHSDRGGNFGMLRTMDNLGALCGIIFCIVFFQFIGFRHIFLIAAIPSIISVLLVFFWLKEKRPVQNGHYTGLRFKDLNRNFRRLLVLSAIFSLGAFSYSFLLIFARDSGFTVGMVPVLYLTFMATAGLAAWPLGKLSDMWGRRVILWLGFLAWAGVCLTFILAHRPIFIYLAFILYGLHKAALDTMQRTFAAELAPCDKRASALGTFQLVLGLCALPSSLLAGLLWDHFGRMAPYMLSVVLTTAASILLFWVKEDPSA